MDKKQKEEQAAQFAADQIVKAATITRDQGLKPRDFLSVATYTLGKLVGASAPDHLIPPILTEMVAGLLDGLNDARHEKPGAKDVQDIAAAIVLAQDMAGIEAMLAALGVTMPQPKTAGKHLRVVKEDQH